MSNRDGPTQGALQHTRLVAQLQQHFPDASAPELRYMQNQVSNLIRGYQGDIYEVLVGNTPPATERPYLHRAQFQTGHGTSVHVCFVVD